MNRYLTTTLPYVNANPHLGHALEFVEADFVARIFRINGDEVFFNIGTDEHGAKIEKKAKEAKETPQKYVDTHAARFREFAEKFDISFDSFIRTTDAQHISSAQEFWKRCMKAGDIYKAEYEVKYCVGCELEKTDSELENGKCPLHFSQEIEIRKEENYYFRFSKYQEALLAKYAQQKDFVVPKERMHEITSFVSRGLKDFSISRRKEKLSWGIPVPGDDEQVMYVWFDALVNYLSVIGWPNDSASFNAWWPVTHFAGKDNLRQQSAMWQAMLLSAQLPFSKQVFIHGFLISDGKKMSKSLGNIIDPLVIIERFGAEALRYILLRHVNPFEDSDVTEELIHEHYTANLTNGLGNLVARVMTLAEEHLSHPIEMNGEDTLLNKEFLLKVEQFRFHEAMDFIFAKISDADTFIAEHKPYKGIKSGDTVEREKARDEITKLVNDLFLIATHLAPAMPRTSATIISAIRKNEKPENLFPRVSY